MYSNWWYTSYSLIYAYLQKMANDIDTVINIRDIKISKKNCLQTNRLKTRVCVCRRMAFLYVKPTVDPSPLSFDCKKLIYYLCFDLFFFGCVSTYFVLLELKNKILSPRTIRVNGHATTNLSECSWTQTKSKAFFFLFRNFFPQ